MLKPAVLLLAAAALATPAFAQVASSAQASRPATAKQAPGLTIDTPIEAIAANPAGKAVLDKDLPGLTAHPMYDMFKSMTLAAVQPMSNGQLTDAQIAQVAKDLAAIK